LAKRKIKWDEHATAAANARSVLPRLAAAYFQEVRDFLSSDREAAEFHRMRLASKRFRYTLELFRPCYGPGLEERLDALKNLQDALGDLNDAVATMDLLSGRTGEKVEKFLSARAEEKAQEFRVHWTESFDAPKQEQWWLGFLRKSHAPARERTVKRAPAAR
jgi:CHAD domain-containing protein